MTLYINTAKINLINIAISNNGCILVEKKINTKQPQSEKILTGIQRLLKSKNIKLNQINKIQVENRGESFTGLRTGVAIANALGYALLIKVVNQFNNQSGNTKKFNIIKPIYSKEPNITVARKKF